MDFDKLHILLVCNLGASTSVMVSKMKEVAEKSEKLKGIDMKIDAYPVGSLKEHVEKYDVILAGPQIKYKEKEISFDIPLLVKASLSLSKLESKLIYQIDQLIR